MALIPSFEHLLLEIHQSLGLKTYLHQQSGEMRAYPTRWKADFADLGLSLKKYADEFPRMLHAVFQALDMDDQACRDALGNAMEWANFYKAMELRTWTGNASQQQVIWHLLAYSYMPTLARTFGLWTVHNITNHKPPLDSGMPGGKFWFLPNWDRENDRIDLPVPQVIDWLFDLLSGSSLEEAVGSLQREKDGRTENGSALRTLQGWKSEGFTPQSARKIEDLFSDDATLEFQGAFALDDKLGFEEQFQRTLDFVVRKKLSAKALWDEIPMTLDRLEPILDKSAADDERSEFVRLIALRYARPEMRTIRQRLRVARMAQDGYRRLLAYLCPDVDENCTDPAQNKLLQLIGLFETIYNLTIEAYKNGENQAEQDALFEARLAPWDKADLLLSIIPSLDGEARCTLLADRLTREFLTLTQDSPLEDLVPWSNESAGPIVERRLRLIAQELEEDARLKGLIERGRIASPWRALQAETSYPVISQFVQQGGLSSNIRHMAIERLRELATTSGQKVQADLFELGFLLSGEALQRPKDTQQRAQSLLDATAASSGFEEWKAPLLRFRAMHLLFQNQFEEATSVFKAALEACSERGFGGLRGEIARDGFATEIAWAGFIPGNQEKYYRNMLGYLEFPNVPPSFEDAATECEEIFWSRLYQPYPGFERLAGPATIQFKAVFEDTFSLIENANWDGLRDWIRRHANKFRTSNLKDARRNSVLLQWLKAIHIFERRLEAIKTLAPRDVRGQGGKIEQHMKNWREAVRLLLEAWPEQANISDFKGQTPLMLVADRGDVELTRLLAPISEVDAQDHLGRTALHAAATGRSPKCVAVVLDRSRYPHDKLTVGEENTALHTAVRVGVPESVGVILHEFPGLAAKANANAKTPLDLARAIIEDVPRWQTFMRSEGRRTGSRRDFDAIVTLLEAGMP